MKNIKTKITNVERNIGNFLYDGLGDILTTEVSKEGAFALGLAGLIISGTGCATSLESIPICKRGKNYSLERKFDFRRKLLKKLQNTK